MKQINTELDAKVGEYIRQKHFFMVCEDYGWSVGRLKFVKDLSSHYSTPKHRRQLPLNACVEGEGDSLYNAIVNAIHKTLDNPSHLINNSICQQTLQENTNELRLYFRHSGTF